MSVYAFVFFVPESAAEAVKTALFESGAGCVGHYDRCCWQTSGIGQFRPLPGANPAIGKVGDLEFVPEIRVEMICEDNVLPAVIEALKTSHPYETPAFQYWRINEV